MDERQEHYGRILQDIAGPTLSLRAKGMIGTTYYWDVFTAEEPPIFIHTIPLKFRDYSYLDIQNEDHQRDYLRGRFGMFFVQSTLG